MFRKLIVNAGLVCLSVVMTLALTETGLRLSGRFPSKQLHSVATEDAARIPGVWEPGQDLLRLDKPQLPHHVRTNSLGLRGPETTLVPTRPRVLCIGDSFTFGDFVDDDETLPAQLQAILGSSIEVLNGGVGGTTIVDQRVFLERMLALKPHVVLLVYSENDLQDLHKDPPMHVQLARNRSLKNGVIKPLYMLVRDSSLFYLLLKARSLHMEKTVRVPAEEPAGSASDGTALDTAIQRYADLVGELRDMLRARDIAFVFAAFPSHYRIGEARGTPPETILPLLAALKARGIDGIDITPALQRTGRRSRELYLLPEDGHPSPLGYQIAARRIATAASDTLFKVRHFQATH